MDVPEKYKTAGIMMLISGALHLMLWGVVTAAVFFVISAYALALAIPTIGISLLVAIPFYCFCLLPLAATVFGGYEAYIGFRVMNGTPVKHANIVSILGIVIAALALPSSSLLSAVPLILEIIATVNLQDSEVTAWIASEDPDLLT